MKPERLLVAPPEWVQPEPGPSTGWLSPDGELYACSPWMHEHLACEIVPRDETGGGAGDRLIRAGWIHVGRNSYSERAPVGGILVVRSKFGPTEAQATVLLAWIEAGAKIDERTDPAFCR